MASTETLLDHTRQGAYLLLRRLNSEARTVSAAEATACLMAIGKAGITRRDRFAHPRIGLYEITLKQYAVPGRQPRWALLYWDGRHLSVTDNPTRDGAEFRYNELHEMLTTWLG